MSYKKSTLVVDGMKYIYSVRANYYDIKVTIYPWTDKKIYFSAFFSYAEAWGINIYCPKTIEILIRFYRDNSKMFSENRFRTRDYPALLQLLVNHYFADCSEEERSEFVGRCTEMI